MKKVVSILHDHSKDKKCDGHCEENKEVSYDPKTNKTKSKKK